MTSIELAHGVCVAHAAIEELPSYLCRADGTWYLPTGSCQCMPGYHPFLQTQEANDKKACVGEYNIRVSYFKHHLASW